MSESGRCPNELFEYTGCYYNYKRKHSSLGYRSSEQFENEYYLNLSKTMR
ncbi:IS3 family transposase [Spirosoma endophyticum]